MLCRLTIRRLDVFLVLLFLGSGPRAGETLVGPPSLVWDVRLHGRLVDGQGNPLTGGRVICLPGREDHALNGLPTRSMHIAFWNQGESLPSVPAGEADAQGRFEVVLRSSRPPGEGDDGQDIQIVAMAPGHALLQRVAVVDTDLELGDLVLEAGGRLIGRAVDSGGQPIPGVRVILPYMQPLAVESDAEGHFTLGPVPPGSRTLSLNAYGHVRRFFPDVRVVGGVDTNLGDVVFEAGDVIEGRVVDRLGRPVARARLVHQAYNATQALIFDPMLSSDAQNDMAVLASSLPAALSGVDGRFVLRGVPHPEAGQDNDRQYMVIADAPGYEPTVDLAVPVGSSPVIVLEPESWVILDVEDSVTGEPVDGARAEARRGLGDCGWSWHKTTFMSTPSYAGSEPGAVVDAAPGRLVLAGLSRSGTDVVVEAPGYGRRTLRVGKAEPGESQRVRVPLNSEASIRGVVEHEGESRGSGWVQAVRQPRAVRQLRWDRPCTRVSSETRTVHTFCDPDGSFVLTGMERGRWTLSADGVKTTATVDLQPGEDVVVDI